MVISLYMVHGIISYSFFMGKIAEYKEKMTIEEAVEAAVRYCIENDILRKFLKEQGAEITNMLFDEMTIDEIAAVRSQEAYEDGREEGLAEGLTKASFLIARNLMSEGSPPEFVQRITGLSLEQIAQL